MSTNVPEYCQIVKVTGADGSVKELIFPKALDLNRPKRPRTTFSEQQLKILKIEFEKNPYLVGKERQKLAKDLDLTETQVKVWFQNRRTKYKKPSNNDQRNDFHDPRLLSAIHAKRSSKSENAFHHSEINKNQQNELMCNAGNQLFPFYLPQTWSIFPNKCCFQSS